MSFLHNSLLKLSTNYCIRYVLPYRSIHVTQAQHLYSISALGIDGYLQARKRVREHFANFSENFKSKMTDFVSDSKNMIFTEDLKNIIHIAEPADIDLVVKMIKKFNTQKTEFRFGSFIFGPIVMRMFHFLDAPNEAIKCFEDSANEDFFAQLVSYQILLDLLFNNEMYDEMYSIFDKIQQKQLNMTKFPKYPVVLILGACYKQNTPKSLEYATKLWSEMIEVGTVPLRRTAAFMAALALNQGAPHLALESLVMQKPHYITVRNIRAVALAELGRLEESLAVLRGVLNIDKPGQQNKHTFFEETMTKVRQAVEKANNKDALKELGDIEEAFKDRGIIDKQSLDQLITSDISIRTDKQNLPRGMPRPQGNRHNKMSYS